LFPEAHVFTEVAAGCRVVDIWESAEQIQRFRDDRLMPAFRKGRRRAEHVNASGDP
jgi:hypothetical protein